MSNFSSGGLLRLTSPEIKNEEIVPSQPERTSEFTQAHHCLKRKLWLSLQQSRDAGNHQYQGELPGFAEFLE